MSQIVLGKVAFVDKGVYATASTYNTFDFVVTDDSCYLCVKDGNKNHPLTDTAWWKCIARGTQATEAAKTALAEANKAIEATRNAISAAGLANAKALEAGKQADLAGRASDEALAAAVEAEAMISEGNAQIASMKAAEQSLMSQALLAPTRMELKYVKRITLGNTVAQRIAVSLFPAYVLLWLCASASLLLLAGYRGQLGIQNKWFFYVFYPAHLLGLWALSMVLK